MDIDFLKDLFKEREVKIMGQDEEYKTYSVVIPIVYDGEYKILFEVRSHKLKFQPGDISLPGGKVEEGESPKEAALRELMEELGISEDSFEYIGQFDTLVTYHGRIIYVFTVFLKELNFNLSTDEVEEIFQVPIKYFKENTPDMYFAIIKANFEKEIKYKKMNNRLLSYRSPIYFYEYSGRIIWGITAKIIYNFIKQMFK
ncbi:CoA pyrophosphatase [Caloramator sp. mosi_1]|uniref:NUDIX hydrolase n=1 Tax=Caloramator sp. mosi_1 TaxID=3023090 RepID=UPI00236268CA|nr:CoA pyrophosphatase [Caloramator sp. mosi_1]WDC83701.1 CoA pyrophosphatase [Caloramator sp. mosi_1]